MLFEGIVSYAFMKYSTLMMVLGSKVYLEIFYMYLNDFTKGFYFAFAGGPLDLMSRRMLCAGTKELALQASKHIIQVYPTPDDA